MPGKASCDSSSTSTTNRATLQCFSIVWKGKALRTCSIDSQKVSMEHPVIPTTRFVQRRHTTARHDQWRHLIDGQPRTRLETFLPTLYLFDKIRPFGITQVSISPMSPGFPVPPKTFCFLPSQHPSDVLWHGPHESNDEIAQRLGFDQMEAARIFTCLHATASRRSQHRDCRSRNQPMAESRDLEWIWSLDVTTVQKS